MTHKALEYCMLGAVVPRGCRFCALKMTRDAECREHEPHCGNSWLIPAEGGKSGRGGNLQLGKYLLHEAGFLWKSWLPGIL